MAWVYGSGYHDDDDDDYDEEKEPRDDAGNHRDILLVLQETLSSPAGVWLLDIGPRHRIWTASPLSASPIRLCRLAAFFSFCAYRVVRRPSRKSSAESSFGSVDLTHVGRSNSNQRYLGS